MIAPTTNPPAYDEPADKQLIADPAGPAPLLRLALPLALLFLAPVAAQLGGHTYPEYRPKLTTY